PAAAVAAPSRYLIEHVRHLRDDVRLLPNALDLADYPFRERVCPEPKLIWLRAFHSIYNPPLAPAVLARVAAEYPDARLVMVGSDKGDGSLQETRAAVERLGLGDKVTMPGGVPKSEVPNRLQTGDIFLNTTNVDNTPVSVLEAMACGLCVVSTSVGGMPYLLEDGVDALLVPPDDPAAMAGAVSRILTEPGLASSLSHAARNTVEAFDWQPILAQWQDLLSSVARAGRTGRVGA
ncbi:MAG TPA: glycosyltransferase, partial [Gemmatimonadaceae bacterium]